MRALGPDREDTSSSARGRRPAERTIRCRTGRTEPGCLAPAAAERGGSCSAPTRTVGCGNVVHCPLPGGAAAAAAAAAAASPSTGRARRRMTFAGLPATTTYGSTSLVTTAPAATVLPSPMVTPGGEGEAGGGEQWGLHGEGRAESEQAACNSEKPALLSAGWPCRLRLDLLPQPTAVASTALPRCLPASACPQSRRPSEHPLSSTKQRRQRRPQQAQPRAHRASAPRRSLPSTRPESWQPPAHQQPTLLVPMRAQPSLHPPGISTALPPIHTLSPIVTAFANSRPSTPARSAGSTWCPTG